MLDVLSRAQVRAFDSHAVRACGVPSLILMENAGRGAALVAASVLDRSGPSGVRGRRVIVVAGAGNNGGDGFVVARHLRTWGAEVAVHLLGAIDRLTGDARSQFDAWTGLGGELVRGSPSSANPSLTASLRASLDTAELAVDALFGTGLDRPIEGALAEAVELFNAAPCQRLALDIPSGLDADTGAARGAVVRAHATATFAAYKPGLLTPTGARHAGQVHLIDLGVPAATMVEAVGKRAELVERSDVHRVLRPRDAAAHKFAAGSVLVLAGSSGKSGAALLAARGALRGGAGLVTIATWSDAHASIDGRLHEVMTLGFPRDLSAWATALPQLLDRRGAVLIGPGFGLDSTARWVAERVLQQSTAPVVVDADALTLFRGQPEALREARGKVILTPHAGEAARLLGVSPADVEADRFGAAHTLSERTGAIVVLKGAPTLTASASDHRLRVNASGGPVLATAGSGDVLGGIIAALACSLDPLDAAWVGAMVHGVAGDRLRDARPETPVDRGILASEIADQVPAVLADFMGARR